LLSLLFGGALKNWGEPLNRSRSEDQQKSTRARIRRGTACNYLIFCKKYLIKKIMSRMSSKNIGVPYPAEKEIIVIALVLLPFSSMVWGTFSVDKIYFIKYKPFLL
jgi:hypothetical protein